MASCNAEPAAAFNELYEALDLQPPVQLIGGEQSNTSVRIGGQLILKLFRRLAPGPHPEVEAGRHFEMVGFDRVPRLAAVIEYAPAEGASTTVGVVHELVWNQGDGWSYTVSEIGRFLSSVQSMHEGDEDLNGPAYIETAKVLARRTAEMHLALADERGLEAFRPEPLQSADIDTVAERITRRLHAVAPILDRLAPELSSADVDAVRILTTAAASRTTLAAAPAPRTKGARPQDPVPRRLSPRPGVVGAERLLHRRLRGRSRTSAR